MGDAKTATMCALYTEHAAALLRFAMRLTGDRSCAEDLVQETLLRAWQHPEVTARDEGSAPRIQHRPATESSLTREIPHSTECC